MKAENNQYYKLEDSPKQVRVSVEKVYNGRFADRVCDTNEKKKIPPAPKTQLAANPS